MPQILEDCSEITVWVVTAQPSYHLLTWPWRWVGTQQI